MSNNKPSLPPRKPPLPPRVQEGVERVQNEVDKVVNKLAGMWNDMKPPPVNLSTKPGGGSGAGSGYPGNVARPVAPPPASKPKPSLPPKPASSTTKPASETTKPASSTPKAAVSGRSVPPVFVDPQAIHYHRSQIEQAENGGPKIPNDVRSAADALRKSAEQAIKERKTYSVTQSEMLCPYGPNHFYSEAPYFWPDEKQLAEARKKYGDNVDMDTIQYYRQDGKRNPAVNKAQQGHLMNVMSEKLMDLTIAATIYGGSDPTFAKQAYERAGALLKVFFLDSKTKMLPSVEYGQVVRGLVPPAKPDHTGRPEGILSTMPLNKVALTLPFLMECDNPAREIANNVVEKFFKPLTRWFETNKPIAQAERNKKNNHGTYFLCQYVPFLSLLGRHNEAIKVLDEFFKKSWPLRIDDRGVLHEEVKRTMPFHYTAYELEAATFLADYAARKYNMTIGFESANHGIKRAIDFALNWWWSGASDPKKIEGKAELQELYYPILSIQRFYQFEKDEWYTTAIDEVRNGETWPRVSNARHRLARLYW